jgi:hypothetical protein
MGAINHRKDKTMDKYTVKLTFTQPLLGTVPKDKEVYATYIASKGENNGDEVETVQEAEEKGWTGFHAADGAPFLYDYQIKGFFKDACSMLMRTGDSRSAGVKAYKKTIDGLLFVGPRQIPLVVNGDLFPLERSLRAQTAKGERVTLARSDAAPVGSSIEFAVTTLGGIPRTLLEEWLEYGSLRGLGQWRNGGYGSFTYTLEKA